MKQKLIKLFVAILIATCLLLGISSISVNASMTNIELIFTNPGEDSSSEMRISFQAPGEKADLMYTIASDTEFTNAITLSLKGTQNVDYKDGSSQMRVYIFEATLSDLLPNTKYIYKIKYSVKQSKVYTFKTAGIDGEFNFALVGDIHASAIDTTYKDALPVACSYVKVAEELTKDIGGIDFVLSQGDLTRYGERYNDWEQWNDCYINQNYMFASVPGNKEYYNTSKAISSMKWFLDTLNNPDNGCSEIPSSYWFKYNSILFLCIDNIFPSFDNEKYTSAMQEWCKKVVKENEGTYQYLIVIKHYPDFISTNTSDKSTYQYGNYDKWYSLYDEINADFVISGDNHSYARSYRLYNNDVCTDQTKGTYYITLPMTCTSKNGRSNYASSSNCLLEWITPEGHASYGGSYFEVTKEGIKYVMFDDGKNILDTVTVNAKREYNYSNSIDQLKNSINVFLNKDNTKAISYYNSGYSGLVKEIKVIQNDKTLATITNGDNTYSFESIKNNDKIELNFTFLDETTYSYSYIVNTNSDYGEIYGFNAKVNDNKLTFEFKADLENDIVQSFEIYKGTNLLKTLDKNTHSYTCDISEVSKKAYTLKALDKDSNVVFSDIYNYSNLGDVDFDGTISSSDLNLIVDAIINETDDCEKQDTNNDNEINIYDLTAINQKRNNLNPTIIEKVKVKFVDINGNVIDVKIINKGESVQAPTLNNLAGYEFVGWDKSTKCIMQDTIIKVVYKIAD